MPRPFEFLGSEPLSVSSEERREDEVTKLQRTTFEISRAAEYFDARQLSALVGVSQDEFAGVCLKELVDNSLDACETAGVPPVVGVKVEREDDLIRLSVSDNGPGMPAEVVRKVLDYNIRVSDKAAYRSPPRGAQGNALKTVIGIPYALGSREPLVVEAQGVSHRIKPWVDPAGAVHFDYTSAETVLESPGTTVSLEMPTGLSGDAAAIAAASGYPNDHVAQALDAIHWARSFAAFNPHATLSYQGQGGRCGRRRNLQIDPRGSVQEVRTEPAYEPALVLQRVPQGAGLQPYRPRPQGWS